MLDFLDIFLRGDVSSRSRAQAFLFLCFNYLEAPSSEDDYDEEPTPNPFADLVKQTSPSFLFLTADEVNLENQDSPEDIANGEKLLAQRSKVVQHHSAKESKPSATKPSGNDNSVAGDDDEPMTPVADEPKPKGRRSVQSSVIRGKKSLVLSKEKKSKLKGDSDAASNAVEASNEDDFIDALIKRELFLYSQPQNLKLNSFRDTFHSSNQEETDPGRSSRRRNLVPYDIALYAAQ